MPARCGGFANRPPSCERGVNLRCRLSAKIEHDGESVSRRSYNEGISPPTWRHFSWNSMRVEGDCASSFVRAQSKSLRRERYNRPENVAAHAAEGSFNLKLARHQIIMLVVMIFGTFVTVLNQTLVTPALPSIMTEMNVDAATAQWLTTGFTPGQRHHDSHYRLSDRPLFHTQPIHGVDAHFHRRFGASRVGVPISVCCSLAVCCRQPARAF